MLIVDGASLEDPTLVGNKFARQQTMRAAGLPVPRFFSVPPTLFDEVAGPILARHRTPTIPVTARAADELLVDGPTAGQLTVGTPSDDELPVAALTAWATTVRAELRATIFAEPVQDAVHAALDTLAADPPYVAVRACVVPTVGASASDDDGEDSATDPMAGLSDSFLYVERADVLNRIAWCLASAFNPEAVLYRARTGKDPAQARVAVGVQQMVLGQRSFVVFTGDPLGLRPRAVIAAAHGIGEGVVQEKADIDHFFVTHDTPGQPVIEHHVIPKHHLMGQDPTQQTAGAVQLNLPAELADLPVLTDAEVLAVHELATSVRELFGAHQDIEGTITEDGALHLLQSRPMVVAAEAASAPTERPKHTGAEAIWTNHNLTESFPGVTSALTFSVAREFYESTFTDFYRRMHLPAADLRKAQHHLRHFIVHVDGYVYYRFDAWRALHGRLPGFELLRPTWEEGLGLPPEHRSPDLRTAQGRRLLLRSAPWLAVLFARHPANVRQFLSWWDELYARVTPDGQDEPAPEELIRVYREVWTEVEVRWGLTLVNGYLPVFFLALARWLSDLRPLGPGPQVITGMLCGGTENRSVAALRSTIGLAELVAAVPGLTGSIRDASPEVARQIWADIVNGAHGPDLAVAASTHLRHYGDRGLQDLKLESVTPRQDPALLLSTVAGFADQGLTVAQNRADEARTRAAAEQELAQGGTPWWHRTALRVSLAGARYGLRVREDTRMCRSQLFGFSRDILRRLGTTLVRTGQLDDVTDIVDLTDDEVLGAFDGTLTGLDLRGLAAHRRAERLQAQDRPALPAFFTTDPARPVADWLPDLVAQPPTDPAADPLTNLLADPLTNPLADQGELADPGATLTGLASSPGTVRARAVVVLDPASPPEGWRGSILVARETDPGWLVLMMAAKAIVVERGSLLSHTAITGRLLGVPTVVAVPHATTRIPHGALVEVDGARGTIRVISSADAETNPQTNPQANPQADRQPDRRTDPQTDPQTGLDSMPHPAFPPPGGQTLKAREEYAHWRAETPLCPVSLSDGTKAVAVTRYQDARAVLADRRFSRAEYVGRRLFARSPESLPLAAADAPHHTRRRSAIGHAFTPERVRRLRPALAELASDLLARMIAEDRPADLVADFARPFAVHVTCLILGVPYEDHPKFVPWATAMMSTSAYAPEQITAAHEEMQAYAAKIVARRRAEQATGTGTSTDTDTGTGTDLITDLVTDPTLSPDEVVALTAGVLIAGFETTANQLAICALLLLRDPGLADRLRAEPHLLPRAVDEMLRWTPFASTGGTPHLAMADVMLPSGPVAAGQVVIPVLEAANRDPEVFDRPDEIRLDRQRNPHLAFGHGAHVCPGAHLARAELEVALQALLDTLPGLRLTHDEAQLSWREGMLVRGPEQLPVQWDDPAPAAPVPAMSARASSVQASSVQASSVQASSVQASSVQAFSMPKQVR